MVHKQLPRMTPFLKPSSNSTFQVVWITEPAKNVWLSTILFGLNLLPISKVYKLPIHVTFRYMYSRASKDFKNEKRKRNAEKCKNYQNPNTFKDARWLSKFYYITRLRAIGENRKISFFQVFHFELYFCFHNIIPS